MENNQSLAVKYRPQKFEDIVGQDVVKGVLVNQIRTNKIKQAYLFAGVVGSGKTTTARIFANTVTDEPIIELDAASHNGVNDVRELIEQSKKMPLYGKYKVFVLDEVQQISKAGWDCMLKLLEEPPATSIFIMCTTEPQKIPDTVKSRLQILTFNKISVDAIMDRLKHICFEETGSSRKDAIRYDIDALRYIASYADGSMRKAISLLERCISISNNITLDVVINILDVFDYRYIVKLFNYCTSKFNEDNTKQVFSILTELDNNGVSLSQVMRSLLQFTLDIVKLKSMGTTADTFEENLKYTNLFNTKDIKQLYLSRFTGQEAENGNVPYRFMETLNKLLYSLEHDNEDKKMLIEIVLLQFMCEYGKN